MKGTNTPAQSRLKISEDVIITVARLAALDVKGVAGLSKEINIFSKLKGNGPITVNVMGDVVEINVSISVNYGAKASQVAQEVETAIKENVQNMAGITVARVNVTVEKINFE